MLLPFSQLGVIRNMAPRKKKDEIEEHDKRGVYSHYIPAVPVLENFEDVYKLKYHLIRSYDELMNFYKNEFKPNSFFAWDTETSSLDPTQSVFRGDAVEGRIVGFSFTQNGMDGYYVPLCHPDIHIGFKALKVLYAMICKSKLHLLYNARFDMRFLEHMTPEKYGYIPEPDEKIYLFDLSKTKYFDVQCSVWLSDSNLPMPSLKKSEKHFLGWNPPTFSETTGGEANFGYLPAEQGYRYACIDALGTYHLFFKTERFYAEAGAAGKLDNEVLYPIMKLENTPIYVDHNYLASMRGDILKHLEELKQYLYTEAGTEYNISSGRELVGIFQQMGIDTGARTATGQMKTDIKTIDNYQTTHGNNVYLKKLVEYKKLLKFDNSYLETLLKISTPEEVKKHPIRFNYFTCRVPTGRLACGTDGKNTFFSPVNFQSLPKPHSHNYHCHKATDEQIARGEDLCGWIFDDNPEGSLGLAEGQDPHLNVRKAFVPKDKDSVIVSVDMKAEELRLAANVFNEPTWINAFNTGQDVHKMTAIKIFGEDNYCKEARKKAKTANFGILYGSSAYGFHNQFPDMSMEECEDFIDKFKAALPSIEAGQLAAVRYGKKNGFVKTFFGRPRRVKYYFNSSNRSMQGYGKRTCMNTIIQGAAGDLIKLMLIRLWNDLFVPYKDKGVSWIGTIHDEVNYVVPKKLLKEVVPIIMRCQTVILPDWKVPMLPDLSIGSSFGSLIPFDIVYNEDGTVKEFVPQMEPLKTDEIVEEQVEDNYIPEIEDDDYDYLQ
jgi:DNA polymerase-1